MHDLVLASSHHDTGAVIGGLGFHRCRSRGLDALAPPTLLIRAQRVSLAVSLDPPRRLK